jgi:hypothetical protein
MKTPWGRAAGFYWKFLWRALLIFCGMCLPFLIIYPFIRLILDAWPLLERLIRLACILTMYTFACCFAIQWAVQSSFRGYLLRILDKTRAIDSHASSSSNGIPLGRAGKLFGAHVWRYLLVVVPVNLTLIWYFLGTGSLYDEGWQTALKVQSINLPIGFAVGI